MQINRNRKQMNLPLTGSFTKEQIPLITTLHPYEALIQVKKNANEMRGKQEGQVAEKGEE